MDLTSAGKKKYMNCIQCNEAANAICQFCGRAVCKAHLKEKSFVSGFSSEMSFWSAADNAVRVPDAVWCGECHPEYESTS